MEISKESHDELMYNKLQKIKDKLIQDQENTSKQRELFQYAILGFALTEAVGLLALMMAFLILFG